MNADVVDPGPDGRTVATARTVLAMARREEITFLAAAIAYYGLVSMVPAVVLALAVTTTVGGVALAESALDATGDLLTPAGQAVLEDALAGAGGRAGTTVLGLLVLAWGAMKGFRGLDAAFSTVYGTSSRRSLLEDLRDATVGLVAVGGAFLGMVVLGGVFAALPLPATGWIGGLVVLLLGLFAAFLPLYALFPNADVGLREAAPGAAIAAVGWVGLQAAFQAYAALTSAGDLYGVLGGVLLLVTWFYAAAVLVLVGAVVNVVLAERPTPDRQAENPSGRLLGPTMDEPDGDDDGDDAPLEARVEALREELAALEADVDDRTVHRSAVEADLRRYVRSRVRRGHARGWGPYLVLLYGTAMTVAAFYLLSGGWAVLAMVVVWLSTLGLYVLMVLAGAAIGALDLPRRALDVLRDRRS